MKAYEYIFAAIVMVAILMVAVHLTSMLPQLYMSISEVEQVKMAAQKVMTQIILSPGDPEDWGGNITVKAEDMTSFGLAVSTVYTRDVFILDPDKVQRLSQRIPADLFIPPHAVKMLLNLGFEYDIRMDFIPALTVTINRTSPNNIMINVSLEQGIPARNAKVTIGAILIEGEAIRIVDYKGVTDGNGHYNLRLNVSTPLLLVVADYHGVVRVVVKALGDVVAANFIGNSLIVGRAYQVSKIYQVFIIRHLDGSFNISHIRCENFTKTTAVNYDAYTMSSIEPNTILIVALTGDGRLVAAWKDVPESYSTTTGETYSPLAYTLERNVKIELSMYTFRLKIWRTSL
ncbi:MAG: hypothetical protein N3F04_05485 [Candidatus Nezhaarchaeota archaeon]|nr:hypothetical protein [Candidatus Nezhaarchaeota archaeon]MCX8142194.1 hypothetical protein [Candidatus Nezhaarchaeota archaeon]MDW8050023.1 hypothetical protein [Nitrososphaerota archaeon]